MFALIYVLFASVTASCGPLRRSGLLLDLFITCNYFRIVLFVLDLLSENSLYFYFYDHLLSFFQINDEKNHLL
jgi:hypothetical protein